LFVAFADDATEFDCDTEPPFPGLRTRTEMFELLGAICFAEDRARLPASCRRSASTTGRRPSRPGLELPCVVVAEFEASADEEAVFDCETGPSLPSLRTRTEMFELLGST
jgi:hypothetical protein